MVTLKAFTDSDLIAELKDRGYAVIHREAVRKVGAQAALNAELLDRDRANFDILRHVKDQLAHNIARELLRQPDFPIRETERTPAYITYQASLTWLGERIGPDHPDYPLYLYNRRPPL